MRGSPISSKAKAFRPSMWQENRVDLIEIFNLHAIGIDLGQGILGIAASGLQSAVR